MVIVDDDVPFRPVCWTAHVPVRFGGAAKVATVDPATIARLQASEKARRFTLISFCCFVVLNFIRMPGAASGAVCPICYATPVSGL
jgi:hypothetical protein